MMDLVGKTEKEAKALLIIKGYKVSDETIMNWVISMKKDLLLRQIQKQDIPSTISIRHCWYT